MPVGSDLKVHLHAVRAESNDPFEITNTDIFDIEKPSAGGVSSYILAGIAL